MVKTQNVIVHNTEYEIIFMRKGVRAKSYDKIYTMKTQCVIREKDGMYLCIGEAIKHSEDKDDVLVGKRAALKNAMKNINWRAMRKEFWNKIDLEI